MTDDYLAARLPDDLPNDPMHWVDAWLIDAADKAVNRNPNSIAIITSGNDARPSARMVLCKEFHADPRWHEFLRAVGQTDEWRDELCGRAQRLAVYTGIEVTCPES